MCSYKKECRIKQTHLHKHSSWKVVYSKLFSKMLNPVKTKSKKQRPYWNEPNCRTWSFIYQSRRNLIRRCRSKWPNCKHENIAIKQDGSQVPTPSLLHQHNAILGHLSSDFDDILYADAVLAVLWTCDCMRCIYRYSILMQEQRISRLYTFTTNLSSLFSNG